MKLCPLQFKKKKKNNFKTKRWSSHCVLKSTAEKHPKSASSATKIHLWLHFCYRFNYNSVSKIHEACTCSQETLLYYMRQLDRLTEHQAFRMLLANIPRPQHPSVTRCNVVELSDGQGFGLGLHLTYPSDETNQTFPEDNLSLLTEQTDQQGRQSTLSEVELENQRANVVSQQLILCGRVLVFIISTVPRADTTKVELTYSIENTELELRNLWD